MESGYLKSLGASEFLSAESAFSELVGWLKSEGSFQLDHGEVEKDLQNRGMELLRLMFQGHLDTRSAAEKMADGVSGADGVERRHRRCDCPRDLETCFGTVVVKRIGYGTRKVKSLFPTDAHLNLPTGKYSHNLVELVAEEASKNSFDDAVSSIQRITAGKIPKRQAEQAVVDAAQDFENFYGQQSGVPPEDNNNLNVLTTDGKGIVMRSDDLREDTRKKAEKQKKNPNKARLSPGEKRNRKRMATVGSVYSVSPNPRTPDDIMRVCTEEQKPPSRPRIENKRVWASVERSSKQMTKELFEEAQRRDPEQKQNWVVLVDGDERQLNRILSYAKAHQLAVTVILDFIHVLEYIWKAAYCFYAVGSEAAEEWVRKQAKKILEGKANRVAAAIRCSATMKDLDVKARKAVDKCADYLLKYQQALQYDRYLQQGFPIATGVIEGACRHLIKDRMELTGARWRIKTAEAVLKLRSLRSSGDLDKYWTFHWKQDFLRNHGVMYAGGYVPG